MPRGELTARRFHDGTKHPHGDLLDPRHRYDPARRPPLEKRYPDAETVELPAVEPELDVPALEAIGRREPLGGQRDFDLASLAHFLHFSAGVTKRFRIGPGRRMPFRAASCTGALYHIELYLACGDLPGLEAGLYAYQPEAHELVRLRTGDPRPRLAAAAGDGERVNSAPVTVIYTSAYWRNAFKYQARAYRHVFWDGGTLLANSLALAVALGWSAQLQLGLVDQELEALLGIEDDPELPVCLLPLGEGAESTTDGLGELAARSTWPEGFRLDWPAIEAAQAATALESVDEVRTWLELARGFDATTLESAGERKALPAPRDVPADPLDEVIRRRGSSRRFAPRPIEAEQLSAVVDRALVDPSWDVAPGGGLGLAEPYLLVNAVEGLEPGVYRCAPPEGALIRVREDLSRGTAGELALGQALGADAAVNIYFLADWDGILALGQRGYRVAQLEGGILGGKIYLAAYGLGLGATGLTFFDDAVASAFGRDPNETAVLFLVAVGHPG